MVPAPALGQGLAVLVVWIAVPAGRVVWAPSTQLIAALQVVIVGPVEPIAEQEVAVDLGQEQEPVLGNVKIQR